MGRFNTASFARIEFKCGEHRIGTWVLLCFAELVGALVASHQSIHLREQYPNNYGRDLCPTQQGSEI